jgi:hypothetical protein
MVIEREALSASTSSSHISRTVLADRTDADAVKHESEIDHEGAHSGVTMALVVTSLSSGLRDLFEGKGGFPPDEKTAGEAMGQGVC